MRFELRHVQYMPADLSPGVVYVSRQFSTAAHLCACGCGEKIRTPLGPTEWSVEETANGPTLRPSVGNWQKACQSHYEIRRGEVRWCRKWTPEQIAAGREWEDERRRSYYATLEQGRDGTLRRFGRWLKGHLGARGRRQR